MVKTHVEVLKSFFSGYKWWLRIHQLSHLQAFIFFLLCTCPQLQLICPPFSLFSLLRSILDLYLLTWYFAIYHSYIASIYLLRFITTSGNLSYHLSSAQHCTWIILFNTQKKKPSEMGISVIFFLQMRKLSYHTAGQLVNCVVSIWGQVN